MFILFETETRAKVIEGACASAATTAATSAKMPARAADDDPEFAALNARFGEQ